MERRASPWRPVEIEQRVSSRAGCRAVHRGVLSVIAPVAALYPVSTVLLALAVDRERVRTIQLAGLGLAATALVLTAS